MISLIRVNIDFIYFIWGLLGIDFKSVGIPTEKEIVDKYCREMNIDEIKDWNVYMAFSYFRIAAIVQGVYKRSLQGEWLKLVYITDLTS